MKDIGTALAIMLFLSPLIVTGMQLLGAKTHNQRLVNLADRASIVVEAIEEIGGANKHTDATKKLSKYAKEVGIKATPEQLSEYVNAAVALMKAEGRERKQLQDAPVGMTDMDVYNQTDKTIHNK